MFWRLETPKGVFNGQRGRRGKVAFLFIFCFPLLPKKANAARRAGKLKPPRRRNRALVRVRRNGKGCKHSGYSALSIFSAAPSSSEKIAVLETRQSSMPIAALRLPQRTFLPCKKVRSIKSHQTKKGILQAGAFFCLVGESGFEPLKRDATDLQSAPFGHSGTLPLELANGVEPSTC